MQKEGGSSSLQASGKASSSSKKRKRSSGNPPNPLNPPNPKQQTISDLFSSSQNKSNSPPSPIRSYKAQSPESKLAKAQSPQQTMASFSTENMYNFPSARPLTAHNSMDVMHSPMVRKLTKPAVGGQQLGARRIEVKNRRMSKSDPQKYFESVWAKLDASLDSIIRCEKQVEMSMEELYRGVEYVCRQGRADELSTRLRTKMTHHASESVRRNLLNALDGNTPNVEVLCLVLSRWSTWKEQWMTIRSIFLYLNQSYLLKSPKPSLQELAIELFRNQVLGEAWLERRILQGTCDLISLDRVERDFDAAPSKNAISMCRELGLYTGALEPLLLDRSQSFIHDWASSNGRRQGLADYVRLTVELLDVEMKRCDTVGLDSSTKRSLLALLEQHTISMQKDRLVDVNDVATLLDTNAVSEMKELYQLLGRCHLEESLRPAIEKWVEATGTLVVFDEKGEDQMIVKLLTLRKQLGHLWSVSFNRNPDLMDGIRSSFEVFINKSKKSTATWNTDNSKPGEMIAKYVDMLLRGGSKAIPSSLSKASIEPAAAEEDDNEVQDEEAEVNEQLDQVLDLFRFLHGKAVFEAFYKKDLARRLLLSRSASADAEISMLTRLKNECGSGFTQNLEKMFKDIELSREEMTMYRGRLNEIQDAPKLDLFVNILSASAWPSYPDIPVNVPPVVAKAIDGFEKHYSSHHDGKKLSWKYALAHCQLKANFPKGKKEIVVSGFQAILLLLFNDIGFDVPIPYERLKAETGLSEPELNRTLQSLACAKLRPLKKHPLGRDIKPTDTFSLDSNFSHEKYRIKINQIQLKETKEENKETHERVHADRNFETQAAIVRIMKSKKQLSHRLLVAEVIEATKKRGVLSVADIKRNIDRLIDKEYLEREEGNSYSYLA